MNYVNCREPRKYAERVDKSSLNTYRNMRSEISDLNAFYVKRTASESAITIHGIFLLAI